MSTPRRVRPAAITTMLLAAGSMLGLADLARAADPPVMLQWFEARWADIERRVPDYFLAGYGSVWLPPPSKASATGSAGYDAFDRFDLGRPGFQTAYGTEHFFKGMIDELHQANGLVYIDAVLNHCSTRQTGASFQSAGGYPGFWMAPANPPVNKQPTDNWGDFHNGISTGYYQSENPGGPRYDLHRGDLVALVDIAQETNHQFIRQPVGTDPLNIPAGTTYNKPDAGNARFYPDQQLTPKNVTSPGTFRNPGTINFSFYPYNTVTPLDGDAVTDNGTGMLMRWTQWMMDEHGVDGFRFDAIKHAPSWFWDSFIDPVLFERRRTPDGRSVTPYTFGECVESNSFTYDNYVRKPNNNSGQSWRAGDTFGNRDALDLNGAGQLRDLLNAAGVGSWQNVINNSLDNADNFNDGTLGMNHVFSHDNGSVGDGGSAPADPTLRQMALPQNAYTILRPGQRLVYHNARGISRSGGFWPRQGVPIALGVDPTTNAPNTAITTLVQLSNSYGRGEFWPINNTDTVNQSTADVLIIERRKNMGGGVYTGNVLYAMNDSYSNGTDTRNVLTTFPAGTRLLEMTGNAADATVDPTNLVPDVLTVAGDKRVTITVPRNRSVNGVEHNKGYVVYGPAIPAGTLTFTNIAGSLPADAPGIPAARRRIAPVPIITANSFEIQLTTTNGDPGAGNNNNADDNAVFRIDAGFRDFNGNGAADIDHTNAVVPGYENFVTQNQPLAGTANTNGLYRQVIDATLLDEGYHYVSVAAFRKRNAGEDPLLREFRSVIYLDRAGPSAAIVNNPAEINATSFRFVANALDRTANRMHIIYDLPVGTDPVAHANANNSTLCTRTDRYEWVRTIVGLEHGIRRITLVAFEESGNAAIYDYSTFVNLCNLDFNGDGFVNGDDFDAYVAAFEIGDPSADYNNDGFISGDDFDAFVADFEQGC